MASNQPITNSILRQDGLASIIIPTYNHEQYVVGAIRSVLDQTYRNFEIIVIDDGSTDNTKNAVAEFGDQVRYIWQENQGLSAARNTGLHYSKGVFIGLLDADDMYEPDFLTTLISILHSDSELDGVFCSARTMDLENNPLPQKIGRAVSPDQLQDKLLKGGFFPPLCMFAYKYCYEEMDQLFDESLTALEDWDMWLRFSKRYTILGVDKALVRYRVVPGSMSRNPERMSNNRFAVLEKYFSDEPAERSQWTPAHRRAKGYSCLRATIEFLQDDNREQACRYMAEAFMTCPELAYDFDFFYKLGLGGQSMGLRGSFLTLDLENNSRVLLALVDKVFSNPELETQLSDYRQTAYANAYLALGLLNYGARRFNESRHFLLRAIAIDPRIIIKQQYMTTLAKSLLGSRVVDRFKGMRQPKQIQ